MPTTRNRWQSEIQHDSSQRTTRPTLPTTDRRSTRPASKTSIKPTKPPHPPASTVELSTDPAETDFQDDLSPPSAKRRRLLASEDGGEVDNEQSHSESEEKREDVEVLSSTNIQPSGPLGNGPPVHTISSETSLQTRLDNLPVLHSLASQVLSVLAKMTPSDALHLASNPNSNSARDYAMARSLFDPVRRLYTTNSPFLSPNLLGLSDPSQLDILRKANQAIYMSSIFTGEIGLRDMDQNFLDVFVPENSRLLKALGSIYLELKTQAFITARRTGAAEPLAVMEDLFSSDMEQRLLDRRQGTKALAPSEQDFLKRLYSRRDILLADVRNNTLDELPIRYRWEGFSREVSAYLAKNFDSTSITAPVTTPDAPPHNLAAPLPQVKMEGQFSIHAPPLPRPAPVEPQQLPLSIATPSSVAMTSFMDDFVAQAARAAEIAMQGPAESLPSPQPSAPVEREPQQYSQVQPNFQHYNPDSPHNTRLSPLSGADGEIPHISQTAPTHVLYERARQVASAKSSPLARKPNTPSQRRPWTSEEENALMTGLDRVKGPHWSQILAMYGPGGTVNESLKDRNQVQLKDKARNLKLFFLKSGIEVPYYLKYVTGDLKTRAPAQALKQEARESEKEQNEESKAHFEGLQGIMALTGRDFSGTSSQGSAVSLSMDQDLSSETAQTGPVRDIKVNFDNGMSDVEAMIARAAAQASESVGTSGWEA